MLQRINIWKIISDHFITLRSLTQKSENIHWQDLVLFIILPIILSSILCYKEYNFEDQVGNLITCVSIFGGFLFNLLAIIYSQIDKLKTDAVSENNELKKKFVKEIHINISFCIVLSILIVLMLLLSSIDLPLCIEKELSIAIVWINYFLMSLFVLTLLMILNRVYILLKRESE